MNSIIEAQAEYFDQQFFFTDEKCWSFDNQEFFPPPSIEDQQKNFWDYKLANDADKEIGQHTPTMPGR